MTPSDSTITVRESVSDADYGRSVIDGNDILAIDIGAKEAISLQWDAIVDDKLIDWGRTGNEIEFDGLVGPSGKAIAEALNFVVIMRKHDWPLPTGVIPDGEGGIAIENRQDPLYQRIEIDEEGQANLITFHDGQFVERVPVAVG